MDNGHAVLAPSAAGCWFHCGGRISLARQFPELVEEETEAQREGTAAHEVASMLLKTGVMLPIDTPLSNGLLVTEEMQEGARLYYDYVHGLFPNGAGEAHIEERMDCNMIHKDCWGTPDLWLVDDDHWLHVFDYKFGYRFVEVVENWQLVAYTAEVDRFGTGIVKGVVHHIVQPRWYGSDGKTRSFRYTWAEMRQLIDRLAAQAIVALADPQCVTGGWCLDCDVRGKCEAYRQQVSVLLDVAMKVTSTVLLPAEIGTEIDTLKRGVEMLKAMLEIREQEALVYIKHGEVVPGYAAEQSQGRQRWNKPVEEVVAMGALMGIDLAKPSAVTPKQAVKAGVPEDLVNAYSETPQGELKLKKINHAAIRRQLQGA